MENIDVVLNALRKNNFEACFAETPEEANGIFFSEILPALKPQTLSWGDSMTMRETKVLDEIPAKHPEISIIKTFDPAYSAEQKLYWRRQALLSDIFLTGSNAVTKSGKIVNLDMVGNRVGAITFGPKNVVLFIGVNKIVDSLEEAFARVRNIAAPKNAIRHTNLKTPCQKTGKCMDCRSADRICNSWTVTAKSFPKNRIKVILINGEFGL